MTAWKDRKTGRSYRIGSQRHRRQLQQMFVELWHPTWSCPTAGAQTAAAVFLVSLSNCPSPGGVF